MCRLQWQSSSGWRWPSNGYSGGREIADILLAAEGQCTAGDKAEEGDTSTDLFITDMNQHVKLRLNTDHLFHISKRIEK